MNAQEAKLASETALRSHADKVYKKIETAANYGHFHIIVETSTINEFVKNMLIQDGYKIEYWSASNDRFSTPDYKISW